MNQASSIAPGLFPFPRSSLLRAEGGDSNPHALAGARVSTAARPDISGSRPFEWNRGELNPVAVLARHSSRPRAIPSSEVSEQKSEIRNGESGNHSSDLISDLWSDRGGNRTHTAQALDLLALPIGLPGHNRKAGETPASSCRPGS